MGGVIVVGGAAGIGRAAVRAFRAQGTGVALIDGDERAAAVAAEPGDGSCVFLHRSPAPPDMPAEAVASAAAALGGIDCLLVTTALMRSAELAGWTTGMWDEVIAINLRLPFLFAQAAAPYLAASANPAIVFVSSTAALRGSPGGAAYQASKAALPALARSLAAELGPQDIRVNCVLPGWIETPLTDAFWASQPDPAAARAEVEARIPLQRQGAAEDVAAAVLFLASPASRYVSGTGIVVDGGYTAV